MDEEEEKVGEEDSQFMKLAKKLTAKKLQKKGELIWNERYKEYDCKFLFNPSPSQSLHLLFSRAASCTPGGESPSSEPLPETLSTHHGQYLPHTSPVWTSSHPLSSSVTLVIFTVV